MAQSSKFARIDEDVLIEFIYHDQSNTSLAEIENDDNGSILKYISKDISDASAQKFLVHEIGGNVVNFIVSVETANNTVVINNFSSRTLQLSRGKTYVFDVDGLTTPANFLINGVASGTLSYDPTVSAERLTFTPSTNGNFTYSYIDATPTTFTGGSIQVADNANPLYAEPQKSTGNNIESNATQGGRFIAVPSTLANKLALLDNSANYLDSTEWIGTTKATFNTVIPTGTVQQVYYDTIRLHLRTGYSFNARNKEGFLIQVGAKRADGVENIFTSVVYKNASNFEIQNPSPFTMGDAMFSKYVEIKVPAIVHMSGSGINMPFQNSFFGATSTATTVDTTSNYNISFKLIDSIVTEDINDGSGGTLSQQYINVSNSTDMVISQQDEYGDISVNVAESTNGDYFEINGLKDSLISNFEGYILNRRQTTADDISVLYEVEVSEQVSTTFLNTYKTTFVHTQDFDKPIFFRPVIINSGICSAFLLRVTMRIYNATDNTQIVKVGTLLYNRPKKYGQQLEKIQIGGGSNIIYNKLPNTSVNRELNGFINSIRPDIGETKYVKVALDKYNVVAAQNVLVGNSASGLSLGDAQFKAEGECELRITSAGSTLVRFTLANKIGSDYRALDLVGEYNIQLKMDNGTNRYWTNHDPTFPGIDLSNGECMFKISSWFANKFNGIGSTGTFYILLRYGSTGTSVLYHGKIKVI